MAVKRTRQQKQEALQKRQAAALYSLSDVGLEDAGQVSLLKRTKQRLVYSDPQLILGDLLKTVLISVGIFAILGSLFLLQ